MVQLAGYYDENAEASTSFDPVPAGDYRAKIIASEMDDISKQNAKGKCLKLTWQIEGGQFDGRLIWQRLNMWAENMTNLDKVVSIAQSQFAAIRQATGRLTVQQSEELHHIPCQIKVVVKPGDGNYSPSNEVKGVNPVGGASAPARVAQQNNVAPAQAAAAAPRSAPWPSRSA